MNYKEENISVSRYLLKKTSVGDQVDIYNCGYYCCSFEIDDEDLFARYLSSDISYQYIDNVTQFDRVIQDTDSEGKVHEHKCKYHRIDIGWTKTDLTKYRVKMVTEHGTLYTRWYSEAEEGDNAYSQMIRESDDVLKNYKSWSREIEYARTERR